MRSSIRHPGIISRSITEHARKRPARASRLGYRATLHKAAALRHNRATSRKLRHRTCQRAYYYIKEYPWIRSCNSPAPPSRLSSPASPWLSSPRSTTRNSKRHLADASARCPTASAQKASKPNRPQTHCRQNSARKHEKGSGARRIAQLRSLAYETLIRFANRAPPGPQVANQFSRCTVCECRAPCARGTRFSPRSRNDARCSVCSTSRKCGTFNHAKNASVVSGATFASA